MDHWIIKLFNHVTFNVVRMAYMMSRSICWMLTGTGSMVASSRKPESYDWSVHIENIFYKHRMDFILEESGPQNFLTTHAGFAHPDEVLKDNYSLYCLTLDEAVFMEVPEDIDVCASKNGSFIKEAQYHFGKRLFTMPIASFHKLAEQIKGPHKPIIFLGNTSRCGSTLVAQIFEKTGRIRSFSEPDGFDALALFVDKKMLPENQLNRMLKNGMRMLLKPVKQDITHYHIKITSMALVMMPIMKEMFPDSIHLFMYREGMAVARSLALSADVMPMLKLVLRLGRIHKIFTSFIIDQIGLPHDIFDIRIKDDVLFCFMVWAVLCKYYLKFRKEGLDIKAIKYEELCNNGKTLFGDPEFSVTEIFKYCGLPLEWVPLGVKAMDVNAHDGPNCPLRKENVHKRPLPVMDPKYQVDADAICDYAGVPRHPTPCVLEGTLTHKS